MSCHQEDTRVVANPQLQEGQPVIDLALLSSDPRLPDEKIQRATTEEELMSNPIDLLSTEIPTV
jgi:hypothetical protein